QRSCKRRRLETTEVKSSSRCIMEAETEVRSQLMSLTMKDIIAGVHGVIPLARNERQKKHLLIARVLQDAPAASIASLCMLARQRIEAKEENDLRQGARKRKRAEKGSTSFKSARLEEETVAPGVDTPEYDAGQYLQLPTQDEVKQCYAKFYQATSNLALATGTCAICARERSVVVDGLKVVKLTDLPNTPRLKPHRAHTEHFLIEGMLLEPCGVHRDLGSTAPPRFSLANHLWIGPTPWVLEVLTFPEQLLIALLYPRVYVFKLFPKRSGGVRDFSVLQSAMRGNVTTYELDMDGIASMVSGDLMPRPSMILASLITVTYIGPGKLPEGWLHSTFRVRRDAVRDALLWLKKNNTKYYGDIQISSQRLDALPTDDVPLEISSVLRQSEDVHIVDEEGEGYVPMDDDEGTSSRQHPCNGTQQELHRQSMHDGATPSVVPLQVSGTIDTDLSTLSAKELMTWGLVNLWDEGQEGGYAVKHGGKPVSDFGRPRQSPHILQPADSERNFFEKAYPCLFPYGEGGIERTQPVPIDFAEHVRWALEYHDRRFRRHVTFAFVTFAIAQRRQALGSARLQMQLREEEQHRRISDPAIQLLRQHLYATAGRVQGSDHSRYQLRSQIWATSIMFNPPSLWLTINPCDLHDPVAQIFAGEHIDMDNFLATIGPSKEKRAENIAGDPYAAAKFFHFTIKTIIQTLFGVTVTPYSVHCQKGIFGFVKAYFGVVESQGR
ncbi:hypothetical protein M404DRAFT_90965, partial [Pisolithus tinctorius Marx 270]